MGRNIVLLSDGTGNSAAKVWRTNVWRTFEALDLSGNDQVAFYDDGVGTSTFKPWAILGGAFGFGLKRNVIDIYKFACRNYSDESDDLYGFGFSRGAFTIRVVIGLILQSRAGVRRQRKPNSTRRPSRPTAQYRRERYHTLLPWHPEDWYPQPFATSSSRSNTTSATIARSSTSASSGCGIRSPPMACR